MKHRVKRRRLGRNRAHRTSMLRNMMKSLLKHGSIETTEIRAKELSSYAEKVITDAKKAHAAKEEKDVLAHKRRVFAKLSTNTSNNSRRNRLRPVKSNPSRDLAEHIFQQLAPRYEDRSGGYTRITRLWPRKGDGAMLAKIELV